MLSSILIIEQVETCAQFDPNHRTGGNLTFIFLRTKACARFDLNRRMVET